jgi:hypothetical protein
MAAIVIKNLSQVLAGLTAFEQVVEKAGQLALTQAALGLERQAKLNANTGTHPRGQGHTPGTGPGPNKVTGTLQRSISTEVRYGFGSYIATVGPSVEYARAVELGSPRWKSGVRYPFLSTAVGYMVKSGNLNRIFTVNFARLMKGL